MSGLAQFLQEMLFDGRIVLRAAPTPAEQERAAALAVLEQAFTSYRLQVAGPLHDLDESVALAAAEVVRHACWFLISRDAAEAVEQALALPDPVAPEQHLSADLCLRYLPQIHQRALALDPADKLTTCLARVLRQWPLSGVLSEVAEGPTTALDFGGHPGLQLLYAERYARRAKPAWIPSDLEYVKLVEES